MHKLLQQHNGADISFNDLIKLKAIAAQYKINLKQKNKNNKINNIISKIKGRGMEFAEVREYLPGDDARSIDWRVTARTGTPHTKVFQQETSQPILIIVDLSNNMQFGTKNAFKSVIAMQLAAIFAFITEKKRENLSFVIFNDSEKFEFLKNKKIINNTNLFIKNLVDLNKVNNDYKNQKYDLNSVLDELGCKNVNNNLIIVLSDFMDFKPNINILAKKNDIINIRIIDPTEKYVPPQGYYPINYDNNFFNLNLNNKKIQQKYQEVFLAQERNFTNLCRELKINHSEILTNDNLITKLPWITRN